MFKPLVPIASAVILFIVTPLHAQVRSTDSHEPVKKAVADHGRQAADDRSIGNPAQPYINLDENRSFTLSPLRSNAGSEKPATGMPEHPHLKKAGSSGAEQPALKIADGKRKAVPLEDRGIATADHWHNDGN